MVNRKARVYISGKITGTTDFMDRFAKAEEKLKAEGYAVLNPAHANSYMPEDTTWDEYMKVSLTLLQMADAIYMLDGWIPVEKAQPEEDGFYIATMDGEIVGQEETFVGLAEFEKWKVDR